MGAVQDPTAQPCFQPHADKLKGMRVFLPAATLRPEARLGRSAGSLCRLCSPSTSLPSAPSVERRVVTSEGFSNVTMKKQMLKEQEYFRITLNFLERRDF